MAEKHGASEQGLVKLSTTQQRLFGIASTVLACLLLQLAFSLFYWLPERSIAVAMRPSLDFLAIAVAILCWEFRLTGVSRAKHVFVSSLTLVLGASVLLGVAQGVAQREFGYHFTLAYHMDKVAALFQMMYDAQSLPLFTLTVLLLIGVVVLLVLSGSWAMHRLFHYSRQGRSQQTGLAAGLAAYLLVAGLLLGVNGSMTVELGEQLSELLNREDRLRQQAQQIDKKMKTVKRLVLGPERRRPTILVFVVESYGQVLLEAEKFHAFRDFLQDSESDLQEHGYATRSLAFQAPVFGGSSWLANASILCRLSIPTEKMYYSLLKTSTRCLPMQFNEAGYESVFAASNTTEITEEYEQRFPFHTYYPRDSFGYKGPRMSWSYMPDQFVIDTVERRILQNVSEKPHFVLYKLTSSHHPWDTIPAYIEDWSKVKNGSIYNRRKSKLYPDNAFLGGTHYNEGYADSVEYSVRTVVGYLNQMPKDRDVLAIVLGDHQPRRPVADMDTDPWTVPLHVISRDAALIDRFSRLNYSAGLFPDKPEGLYPGLHKIAEHLFRTLNDVSEIEIETVQ